MSKITVLGLDPGFANMGWAEMCWDRGRGHWSVARLGVLQTGRSSKKLRLLQCEDEMRRADELSESLLEVSGYTQAVVVESRISMPGSKRGSHSSATTGIPYGIVAMLRAVRKVPLVQVTPQQIKKTLCGKTSASKADVQWAVESAVHCVSMVERTAASKRHHVYDAIAAVLAADGSDVMRAIKRREVA